MRYQAHWSTSRWPMHIKLFGLRIRNFVATMSPSATMASIVTIKCQVL